MLSTTENSFIGN